MSATKEKAVKEKPVEVNWTYQAKRIKCGKKACKSCPHGPYLYRHRTTGGKSVCEYVGKIPDKHDELDKKHEWRYALYDKEEIAVAAARKLLGIKPHMSLDVWHIQLDKALRRARPGKNGKEHDKFFVHRAWNVLVKRLQGKSKKQKRQVEIEGFKLF